MKMDGASLAILNARFEGVSRKMSNTLLRTGRSGVLNRARDFSCCVVTSAGDLLTAAESLPIHVLSGPELMVRSMIEFHPQLCRGDAFLHNSPYHGCSHPADHTLLVPVFDKQDRHRFTVLAKAHQADIGNAVPTTYYGAATDVYNEGALIFPAVKIQSGGEFVGDIVRMCRLRIRVPEQWYGDLLAMVGAARIGEREIESLAAEYGWDSLSEFAAEWFNYSERRARAAIQALPAGTVTASSTHDRLPGVVEQEIRINATVRVDAKLGRIEVDLRDNPDCLACGLNVSESCARTSAMIGVFNSIDHSIPKNAGSMRCLDVQIRPGSIAGGTPHPFSCSVATTNVSDRIANAVQKAFAALANGYGMAEIGAALPPSHGVISGVDPRDGEAFINQVFLGSSGGGASPGCDGWLLYPHAGNGGMGFIDSVELTEQYHPIRIHARYFLPDTEGAGRTRGAPSKYVEYGPDNSTIQVAFVADGSVNCAQGVRGGQPGGAAKQLKRKRDGTLEALAPCGVVTIEAGERIVAVTCGGGGYGPPQERERARVAEDVREGWITDARAIEVYGWSQDQQTAVPTNVPARRE
jgi:N-methylhydantoinase B